MNSSVTSIHRLVWTAMMAALIGIGAFVKIPLGPIPFTMQTFFVVLAGFVLGPRGGAMCVALYIAAGVAGLPVFSGGGSGVGHLFGPTGGYLAGFVVCAAISGLAHGESGCSWAAASLWGGIGTAVMLIFGVGWLMFSLDMNLAKAFSVGCLPFLPGAAVKLALAVSVRSFLLKYRLAPN